MIPKNMGKTVVIQGNPKKKMKKSENFHKKTLVKGEKRGYSLTAMKRMSIS